jgi:hypothetical protein
LGLCELSKDHIEFCLKLPCPICKVDKYRAGRQIFECNLQEDEQFGVTENVFELVNAVLVFLGLFLNFSKSSGVGSEFFLSSFRFTPKVSL